MKKARWILVSSMVAALGCESKKKAPAPDGAPTPAKSESKQAETPSDVEATKAEPKPFDIEHDKSGILPRAAAALEAEEAIDDEDLRELSHHVERSPSVEALCRHIAELREMGDDISACVKETQHHLVNIGPELYADWSTCLMAAKALAELDTCDAAETEIEQRLHLQKRGDDLDEPTCQALFDHFEKLAMEDAGDQAETVEQILEEVKGDVITACREQGTNKEVECAMKATALPELKTCASSLL